jgi:hypothetical protein
VAEAPKSTPDNSPPLESSRPPSLASKKAVDSALWFIAQSDYQQTRKRLDLQMCGPPPAVAADPCCFLFRLSAFILACIGVQIV